MNCVWGWEGATAGLDLTLVRSSPSTHSLDAVETASVRVEPAQVGTFPLALLSNMTLDKLLNLLGPQIY